MAGMIKRFFHIDIVVRDMARSVRFYEALGFVKHADDVMTDPEIGRGIGLDRFGSLRGVLMRLPDGGDDQIFLDLTQFVAPASIEGRRPVHQTGLSRMCFMVDDFDAAHDRLRAMEVEFIGPVVTLPEEQARGMRMVSFRDPDGTFLEILGR
jgi:catechol 2,3-dioxygenase-like lactoylglutathione lyase family enzyme